MKGVSERTMELLNEYQADLDHKSWWTFQHFLVVKIEELEADIEKYRLLIIDCPECYQTMKSMHAKLTTKEQSNVR